MRYGASIASLAIAIAIGMPEARADEPSKDKANDKPHTEFGGFPAVGGDSDIGFGPVAIGAITGVAPGVQPYVWRAEAGLVFTFKLPTSNAPFRVRYQDYYITFTVPQLVGGLLRLDIRPSFTWETTNRYYGIGNQAPAPTPGGPSQLNAPFYLYERIHATLVARARYTLGSGFFLTVGNSFTENWINVNQDTQLFRDQFSPNPTVRKLLDELKGGPVDFFEYTLELDKRDDEISTSTGLWEQLQFRAAPGGNQTFHYRYGQLDAIVRHWVRIGDRVVLAGRAVGDVQFGDVPFFELTRYQDTFAPGGAVAIRGVPAGRYYGKVKVFGNFECQTRIVDFPLFKKKFSLGVVGFFDAGRIWTEFGTTNPALDGDSFGLKWGTGVGFRLRQGTGFVVRGDVAWSPDAQPIGGYLAAGEMF